MHPERKIMVCDRAPGLEACRFQGITRPFPNHVHPYYVIGLVERGTRRLSCGGRTWSLGPSSLVLFAPGDSHGCIQTAGAMDYRSFHLSREALGELTGRQDRFALPTVSAPAAARRLRALHGALLDGGPADPAALGELLELLFRQYGQPDDTPPHTEEIEALCRFLEARFSERISLEDLCRRAGLSKSTLLRCFLREKGVTPYRYLESVRVEAARRLLAQGIPPAETALRTGFSDQSHLTHCFVRLTGLSPGAYRDALRRGTP